jgi:hypothetical protein
MKRLVPLGLLLSLVTVVLSGCYSTSCQLRRPSRASALRRHLM